MGTQVSIQLQFSSFPDKLKMGEILDMYQPFYQHPEELAQSLGLGERLQTAPQGLRA
jgi:hypothetical protein